MDAFGSQAVALFPVIQAGGLVALEAAGGLSAQDVRVGVIELSMQQLREHRANLGNGDRRRDSFSPVGSPE
jgi:NAD(P)H-nitrite reductase large subunit